MIRCIAIDDEPLALEQVKRYIAAISDLDLLGAFYSVTEARQLIEAGEVDLIFLDIDMPDANGMEFAGTLDAKCNIVFTTAYPQYAVAGFRVDAVDYLLKPLSFKEFSDAVEKVKRRMAEPSSLSSAEIFVKESGVMHKIKVEDIKFVQGCGEYIRIALKDRKTFLTVFESIKHFESQLPRGNFMRIHKSYMVNLDCISEANRHWVVIEGDKIPVGEKYRKDFVEYLKQKNP